MFYLEVILDVYVMVYFFIKVFLFFFQVIRIVYGGNKEFKRVVILDGVLFEKFGIMSGGGSKLRGGRMGIFIRVDIVFREVVVSVEKEFAIMVDKFDVIRKRIFDVVQSY